jgi:4-hydroxy-tetrahydrodipicolinate reductase
MIQVAVTGAAGRMGAQIVRMLHSTEDMALAAASERAGFPPDIDAGVAVGIGPIGLWVKPDLAKALEGKVDVVIDFTTAAASVHHAEVCAAQGVALVIGSTGFSPEAKEKIDAASKKIPIVMSANMSVGVNVMFKLVREAAVALGDAYDVEIVEMHHKKKKDAPSGTAERLAEIAVEALGLDPAKDLTYTRHGLIGERPPHQIGVQALRGGDVVGDHTVFLVGEGERLEITHRATSREQFARGAIRAARWIPGRPAGLYDMQDVLGLRR